jgi:hypothetical protein
LPSEVITIFAMILSGKLIPSVMASVRGSEISSVAAWGAGAGVVAAAVLKAL